MPPHLELPKAKTLSTASSSDLLSTASSSSTKPLPLTREFLRQLPKCELHLHLEGTLEAELLFALAKRNEVSIPYASVTELKEAYQFQNLQEFLNLYYQGAAVLQQKQDFYDLTFAYLKKCQQETVVHVEVFFDPQTHTERGIDLEQVVGGIHDALEQSQNEFGITYKLIPCFLRHLSEEAAFEILEDLKPYYHLFTGFGLDSTEVGHPPKKFEKVFRKVREELGFKCCSHAGEEGPPDPYLWGVLKHLQVDRIDHGIQCLQDEALCQHLSKTQMALTLCPLSNLELQVVKDLRDYPLRELMERNLLVTINSDDPAYFGGYVTENYWQLVQALELSVEECVTLAKNSFRGSFMTDNEKEKGMAKVDEYVAEWKNAVGKKKVAPEAVVSSVKEEVEGAEEMVVTAA